MAHPTPHDAAREGTGGPHGAPHMPNGDQSPHSADKPSGGRIELRDGFSVLQWVAALNAVGRAVRNAQTASRVHYDLAPPQADLAYEQRLREQHDLDVKEINRLRAERRQTQSAVAAGHCPTLCDDDCDAPCHEVHAIPRKRGHEPAACPATLHALADAVDTLADTWQRPGLSDASHQAGQHLRALIDSVRHRHSATSEPCQSAGEGSRA